eukprot:COSAG05_NODE_18286_length_310_cov_1.710900_2_plen_66_part_01
MADGAPRLRRLPALLFNAPSYLTPAAAYSSAHAAVSSWRGGGLGLLNVDRHHAIMTLMARRRMHHS